MHIMHLKLSDININFFVYNRYKRDRDRDMEEEEEAYERRKLEKKIREKEMAYQEVSSLP